MNKEFIKLEQLNKDIKIALRYSTKYNFANAVIPGYKSDNTIIISKKAGDAFLKVQDEVHIEGYNLVFYDAYRPKKATKYFGEWSLTEDETNKNIFYPNLTKQEIFEHGLIAEISSHTRGGTADVTIIEKGKTLFEIPKLTYRTLKNGNTIPFYDDNSVDMGSSFDLFDAVSSCDNREITDSQYEMRMYLQNKMIKNGFLAFKGEWWHFTLKDEQFPDTYFDFDVV